MTGACRAAFKITTLAASPPLSAAQCFSLLQAYTKSRSLREGKQLHARIVSGGLLPNLESENQHQNHDLLSRLASMYALCGDMSSARKLFDHVPQRTTFLWNNLIRGYARTGLPTDALRLLEQMALVGDMPDKYTFTFGLKACADLSRRVMGLQIHSRAVVAGFGFDGYVQNGLVSMYMSCGDKEKAWRVFDGMHGRTVASWNSMIAGLVENGCYGEALEVFDRMLDSRVELDCVTLVAVLPACASLKDLQRGRMVQKMASEKGFIANLLVRNALIDMYAKCDSVDEAREIFDNGTSERDIISWTAMIGGYALNGCNREAFSLFHEMQFSKVKPNAVTMASVLSTCTDSAYMRHGKSIHGLCLRLHLSNEIIVETALLNMYVACGNMNLSSLMFAKSSKRTATWNVVISCYHQIGLATEAIQHFKLMLVNGICPNTATIMSVLPAYSNLADLQQAENIHCYIVKTGFSKMVEVATGMIDLYAKIGNLGAAHELFDRLPAKDIVTWSAIIAGYGMHGNARIAIKLFDQMVESGVEPNEVTFLSILQSCSYAGLVDEGFRIVASIASNHYVKPGLNHYVCIVDLLGRAGRLNEAIGLIKRMPFEPCYAIWGALLGACVIHGNVKLGEEAAKHLFELEPENTGNYVLLGNLFAAVGRWEDAESVRSMVKEKGLVKVPGGSLIEARGSRPSASIDSKLEEKVLIPDKT